MRRPTAQHVDLTSRSFERKPIPSNLTSQFIGGRGINMAHLHQVLSADIPAVDSRTPLLFAAGPLVPTCISSRTSS